MNSRSERGLAEEIGEFIEEVEAEAQPQEYSGASMEFESTYDTTDSFTIGNDTRSAQSQNRSNGDALGVGQAEVAYLDDNHREFLGREALETGSLATCYGLALRSESGDSYALMHLDMDKLAQAENGIDEATSSVSEDFSEAVLVTSQGDEEEFSEVASYLQQEFGEENVETRKGRDKTTLGIDRTGFYEPENPAVNDLNESTMEMSARASVMPGKIYNRTEEVVREEIEKTGSQIDNVHLPGEYHEKWVFREDGGKKYARKLHRAYPDSGEARYELRLPREDTEEITYIRWSDRIEEAKEIMRDMPRTERSEVRRMIREAKKVRDEEAVPEELEYQFSRGKLSIRSRHDLGEHEERVEQVNQIGADILKE